jgi:hypothetical protein
MRLFSFFTSRKDKPQTLTGTLVLDLVTFDVGSSCLGKPVAEGDFFAGRFDSSESFINDDLGIELGTKGGVLDSVCLTLENFTGKLLCNGVPTELGEISKEDEVVKLLGEPYWIDRSDSETVLFYEYASGTVELQFEFSETQLLGLITLARNGVLSEEEQRKAYRVDKPWPPHS